MRTFPWPSERHAPNPRLVFDDGATHRERPLANGGRLLWFTKPPEESPNWIRRQAILESAVPLYVAS